MVSLFLGGVCLVGLGMLGVAGWGEKAERTAHLCIRRGVEILRSSPMQAAHGLWWLLLAMCWCVLAAILQVAHWAIGVSIFFAMLTVSFWVVFPLSQIGMPGWGLFVLALILGSVVAYALVTGVLDLVERWWQSARWSKWGKRAEATSARVWRLLDQSDVATQRPQRGSVGSVRHPTARLSTHLPQEVQRG